MISAGEASGDAHAAHALLALQEQLSETAECIDAFGMGGTRLQAAGCDLVVDNRDLSVIGFVDVLINYPKFLKRLEALRQAMRARLPDVLLIADYPDFNLKLADTARGLGIPVVMYVAPQVWAWRQGRIPGIARRVSHMAVLFPFEVPIWEGAGVPTTYVGHPMVRTIDTSISVADSRKAVGIATDVPLIALLPGSRPGEIKRLLPLMLRAAHRIARQSPDCHFVLPLAPSIDIATVDKHLSDAQQAAEQGGEVPTITVVHDKQAPSTAAMRAADVVLVASGTATLETGLVGTPMVVVYAVSRLNAMLMRRLVKLVDLALVNIVAGRRIVPEFIQEKAEPLAVSDAVIALLNDKAAQDDMRSDLEEVKRQLGDIDASDAVARILRSHVGK